MKAYTVYFTDGRWSFTVEIFALNEEDAKREFWRDYPEMYIEDVKKSLGVVE